MLLTMEAAYQDKYVAMPNPERKDKVGFRYLFCNLTFQPSHIDWWTTNFSHLNFFYQIYFYRNATFSSIFHCHLL